METQVSRVVPGEGGELEVWASTQDPAHTQAVVARILGLPASKVVVKVKRMGGAFGGKETKSVLVTAAVALAARVTVRPVRCMLDRQEDMVMTGQRHPYLGNFRVAFTSAGLVTAVAVDLYSNGGWCADLSCAVMARSLFHADGSYRVPNLRARGFVCRTNTPSNTAFRGFGLPQVAMVAEGWVEAVADALGLAPEEVRVRNLYREGDTTHFGQEVEGCTLGRCWEECRRMAGWEELEQQVRQFNAANRWKKRGLAMVPVKMGVRYAVEHLNQGGCLLNIYTDGSVLLAHGGTEMGQGLHTKMVQVCAHTLAIHHTKVHVVETSTDKVPNASATSSSVTSDLVGAAVVEACTALLHRLEPYRVAGRSWEEVVVAAHMARVSLSSTGFYSTPGLHYDFKRNCGRMYNYFCYGAGSSLVEVDCLTGDHHVLRTDLMMDVGESLNPAVDVGQIEGAFLQEYGMLTMEQVLHSPTTGALLTRGPGTYKIPSLGDVPAQFHTGLLRGSSNPRALYSSPSPVRGWASRHSSSLPPSTSPSRGRCGVPGRREEEGLPGGFPLGVPATVERVRMACTDRILERLAPSPEEGAFTPWAVQL